MNVKWYNSYIPNLNDFFSENDISIISNYGNIKQAKKVRSSIVQCDTDALKRVLGARR
ncbi:MAG: hypothetical protein ACFFCE_00560 [Promethearchaeota archaeon]